jgi:hypothetical protein
LRQTATNFSKSASTFNPYPPKKKKKMPHKHKRRKENNTASIYDLPPTAKARPLAVGKHAKKPTPPNKKKNKPSDSNDNSADKPVSGTGNGSGLSYGKDDTPRAFARLLQYQKTGRGVSNGLDNGNDTKRSKKRKRNEEKAEEETSAATEPVVVAAVVEQQSKVQVPVEETLKIQPGEKLSDFAIRVDQALPLSGISAKGKKVEGLKERRTKHDKRLLKLQSGWREEEAKIREKEEEKREIAEEEWEEKLAGMDREARAVMLAVEKQGKSKKKKGKLIGEVDEDDDDPWAVLKEKREKPKGVFDVVQAPPTFKKIPREIFKESRAKDVPKGAGSLRRREELGQTRADIIAGYRAIMAQKRS